MAEPKTDALVKSLESLVAEKQAVTSKEKELVDGLNAVLSKMGYRVVTATAVPKRRGRPPGSTTGKRRGRPPGSGKKRRGAGLFSFIQSSRLSSSRSMRRSGMNHMSATKTYRPLAIHGFTNASGMAMR